MSSIVIPLREETKLLLHTVRMSIEERQHAHAEDGQDPSLHEARVAAMRNIDKLIGNYNALNGGFESPAGFASKEEAGAFLGELLHGLRERFLHKPGAQAREVDLGCFHIIEEFLKYRSDLPNPPEQFHHAAKDILSQAHRMGIKLSATYTEMSRK